MKIITEDLITIFDEHLVPTHVTKAHPRFTEIKSLVLEDKIEEALALTDMEAAMVETLKDTELSVKDGGVFYGEYPIEGVLGKRLLQFLEQDIDIKPLYNFVVRLYKNSSYRAVKELFGFLEQSSLPITPDGCFMAYKKVTVDYTDCFTRSFDNSVGAKVSMPRHAVNEDKEQTCSAGLHFAAYNYADSFGRGPLMAIKIDPADVVAIPSDYNNEKGRCCGYEVVAEVHGATLEEELVYASDDFDESDYDEYDEECEEDEDYYASDDGCDSRTNDV